MSNLSIGISPGPQGTRVIAMAGPSDTILKARLSRQPSHPRALPTLRLTDAGRRVSDIHDFRSEHFELEDYHPHPAIAGIPVAT